MRVKNSNRPYGSHAPERVLAGGTVALYAVDFHGRLLPGPPTLGTLRDVCGHCLSPFWLQVQ